MQNDLFRLECLVNGLEKVALEEWLPDLRWLPDEIAKLEDEAYLHEIDVFQRASRNMAQSLSLSPSWMLSCDPASLPLESCLVSMRVLCDLPLASFFMKKIGKLLQSVSTGCLR